MAAEAAQNSLFLIFTLFCINLTSVQAGLFNTCKIPANGKTYTVAARTWEYRSGRNTYKINLCNELLSPSDCKNSAICKLRGSEDSGVNLGTFSSRNATLFRDGTGFSVEFSKGTCEEKSNGKAQLTTRVLMKCGKTMGYPELIDQYTTDSVCLVIFEFITNEACQHAPTAAEVPCSFYSNKDNKRRDLTPLVKIKGGHEVASQDPTFDFHINICREITPEASGHTHNCTKSGSASCRRQTKDGSAIGIGDITKSSMPVATSKYEIVIVYNTTAKVTGCAQNPSTKITLVCPKELHQTGVRGPVLTSFTNCIFEVFWETEYACPQETLISNTSCILSNEYVQFNLTPLYRKNLHNYKVYHKGSGSDASNYTYFINVCGTTNIPKCKPDGNNASICQELPNSQQVFSLGNYNTQKLQYSDGQLTLTYKGGMRCHNGFKRETVITFKCNPTVDQGTPVFSQEIHCLYLFEWETKHACPPSRRTGTACRVTNNKGVRYDLSELVRLDRPNWLAVDGEASSSNRLIYLNVCGKLSKDNRTSKCNSGASACMVLQDGSVFNLGSYSAPPVLNPDLSIKLAYQGGDDCVKGVKRSSTITFVCHPGDLTSPPVLVSHSQDNCQYTFMWKTAAACSLGVNTGKNCKVQDKDAGYVFDLTALANNKFFGGKTYATAINSTGEFTYFVKVCGSFNVSKACTNAGACQQKTKKPSETYLIGRPNSLLYYYDGIVKLTYADGSKCRNGKPRKSHISFMCDPQAMLNGVGLPSFDREDACTYHFRWFTKYACPAKIIECAARSGSDQYDLSTLVKTQDNWLATLKPGLANPGKFYINICRSLNLKPEVRNCKGSSAICLIDSSGKAINLGGVDAPLRVAGQNSVSLTYMGGDRCPSGGSYSTEILFICRAGATDTSPVFQGKDKCKYKFRWETAASCIIRNVVGANCSVQDPKSDTVFNLYPLYKENSYYDMRTPDGRVFQLNICGQLNNAKCVNKNDKQSQGQVGACMTETDNTKLILGLQNQKLEFRGETLVLTYSDGDRVASTGLPRLARIRFYCDPKQPLGQPKYIEQASTVDGEVFYFNFPTSLACSAKQVQCVLAGPDNNKYDLTPLSLLTGNWEAVDVRPAYKHLHYFINVCRPYNPPRGGGTCPGGAIGACQEDHKTNKGHNLGYVQSNPQVAAKDEITLRYFGGDACHGKFNRSTRINLHCSKTMGSPIFTTETPECEYVFDWQTPSACHLTRSAGPADCTVKDEQYDYQFDLSSLYNSKKDYTVSLAGGLSITLNVCNKIRTGTCGKEVNVGACRKNGPENKDPYLNLGTFIKNLTYFDGEIFLRYKSDKGCSLLITFECDASQRGPGRGPVFESLNHTCDYSLRWATDLACRPITHVQCSLRKESANGDDVQYDFTELSKANANWKAISSGTASYYINVCRSLVLTSETAQCSPTAGICKYDSITKKYTNLGSLKRGPQAENKNLYLLYEGGDSCGNGKLASAKILMECGSSEEAAPQFVNEYPSECRYEFLWTTKYACAINTVNQTVTNDCKATNPVTNYEFDISKLRNPTQDYRVDDRGSHTFLINVCGSVVTPGQKCGNSSGSCQQDGSKYHNAGNVNNRLIYRGGALVLTYTGGEVCHHSNTPRQTIISFVCNATQRDYHGTPVFVEETDDCVYYFVWETSYACERKVECSPVQYKSNTNTKYSLRKLTKDSVNWVVVPTGPASSTSYYINVCRSLVPIPGVNCPAGASACEKKDKVVTSLGRAIEPPEVDGNGNIIIVYQDGDDHKSTRIILTCAPGTLGVPVYQSPEKSSKTYVFSWATSAACPQTESPNYPQCSVYDNSTEYTYNMTPLKNIHGTSFITMKAPDGSTVYASVCAGLSGKIGKNCDGASVCQKPADGKEPIALGYEQHHSITYLHDENSLLLKYCNKDCSTAKPNKDVISRFLFICDEKATSTDQYYLESVGPTGANIVWRTQLACPPAQMECIYSSHGNDYDLQLLSSRSGSWYYQTTKGDKFWFNICRGITDVPNCPSSASVCAKFHDSDKVVVLGYTSTQNFIMAGSEKVVVKYTGQTSVPGCSSDEQAFVKFQYQCGKQVGKPKLVSPAWNVCGFTFMWTSVAACKIDWKPLSMANCQVKHPLTHQSIDFRTLERGKSVISATRSNAKDKTLTTYYMSLCGSLAKDNSVPGDCYTNNGVAVCIDTGGPVTPMKADLRQVFYEALKFEFWITTDHPCDTSTDKKTTFIINFQCADQIPVGKPKFLYESSACHVMFEWPTALACTRDQSGEILNPTSAGALSSAGKKAGVAFAVIFSLLFVAAIVFVLHKRSRRQAIIRCFRFNCKKCFRRGEDGRSPVYKYQKIEVDADNDGDLLLGISDHEDEEEDDDEDMLTI